MTGRLVCFDVGERRIGIAASDLLGITAQPVETYTRTGKIEEDYQYLAKILRDQEAVKLVVGLPKNMNNTQGPRAEKTLELKQRLEELLPGLPITLWDERSTTVSAIQILNTTKTRGKKRKNVVDSVAAVLILESYLNYKRLH